MTKLSKENFEFFKKECLSWTRFFGIYQWDCRFIFEDDDDAMARIEWGVEDGIACFYLAKKWDKDEVSDYNLSLCAFHEVCELLLSELNDMARRCNKDRMTNGAIHRVIRTLENTIFEYEWEKHGASDLS